MKINYDCKYFDGYKPCIYNKTENIMCEDCKYYKPIKHKILIIKARAAGDVVRHTIILHELRKRYPNSYITWITDYPELVPKNAYVDRVLKWNHTTLYCLESEKFDIVYSLDKDADTCTLCRRINSKIKKGFTIDDNGKICYIDKDAKHKFLTGIFDNLMKKNKRNYLDEVYEICGWKYNGEKYILPEHPRFPYKGEPGKKIVGLNTGAGALWKTRRWPEHYWVDLALMLKKAGYVPLLLGGPKEHELNLRISKVSGALYLGHFSLIKFIGLVDTCDLVVTTPSVALHLSLGLNKKVVVLNAVFPSNEFYLFGKGVLLVADVPCKECYKPDFDGDCHSPTCMEILTPKIVLEAVNKVFKE